MASKRSIYRAQAHVPDTCTLCDNTQDVYWFCNDCQENLCERCKHTHARGRKTRNDDIVPIKEANRQGEAIIPEVCKIHPGKSCDLYCKECDAIMCVICFAEKHKHHDFKTIEEEIISQKKFMQDELDELRSKIDQSDTKLTQHKQDTKSFEQSVDNAIEEVDSRRSELKAEVDSMADSIITELSSLLKEVKESDDKDCRRHEKNIQEMKNLIRDIERETKQTSRISTFIELTKKLKTTESLYDVSTEINVPRPPQFVPGTINTSQLRSMLGYIQEDHEVKDVIRYEKREIDSTHVKQISTFKGLQWNQIISICPTDDQHAWISVRFSNDLFLVNKDGKVIESVKLDFLPWFLALTNTGGLLMTRCGESSLINNLSEDRRVTTFADISPLRAWGIGVSDNDEVVVSTYSKTILVLNKSGDKVRQLSCRGNGRTIVCLTTGHVAVVVESSDDGGRRELVIKNQSDRTVHTWRGELDNGQKVSEMRLCQIDRDMYDRVFVPDYNNNQVYVVSGDDRKASCLLDKRHGISGPTAVGVDLCGHVWVGYGNGNVRVMEL